MEPDSLTPPPVSVYLTEHGIPHRIFRHGGPVASLEQAALERGQEPEQVVRSLVFRLSKGEYLMVLVAGPRQVSWPALRRHVGQSRLTLASEEEVLQVTGYPRGAVSPFGLPVPIRILADEGVFVPQEVSIGSGVRGVAILISTAALRQALGELETGRFLVD